MTWINIITLLIVYLAFIIVLCFALYQYTENKLKRRYKKEDDRSISPEPTGTGGEAPIDDTNGHRDEASLTRTNGEAQPDIGGDKKLYSKPSRRESLKKLFHK